MTGETYVGVISADLDAQPARVAAATNNAIGFMSSSPTAAKSLSARYRGEKPVQWSLSVVSVWRRDHSPDPPSAFRPGSVIRTRATSIMRRTTRFRRSVAVASPARTRLARRSTVKPVHPLWPASARNAGPALFRAEALRHQIVDV